MKNIVLIACLGLAGCASIVDGSTQNLSVDTSPSGAECTLSNEKGKWYVKDTPNNTMVHRSASALSVVCEKGRLRGSTTAQSSTKGLAFGNILAGGIIGAAVDMSDGSAYDYPPSIMVKLK